MHKSEGRTNLPQPADNLFLRKRLIVLLLDGLVETTAFAQLKDNDQVAESSRIDLKTADDVRVFQ